MPKSKHPESKSGSHKAATAAEEASKLATPELPVEEAQSLTDEPLDQAGHSKELHPDIQAEAPGQPSVDAQLKVAEVHEAEKLAAQDGQDSKHWPVVEVNSDPVLQVRYRADSRYLDVHLASPHPTRGEVEVTFKAVKPTLVDALLASPNPGEYYLAHVQNMPLL